MKDTNFIYKLFTIAIILFAKSIIAQENPLPPATPYSNSQSQNQTKDFNTFKERLFFGGTVGAWFGSTTYVNLSPIIGVKITKNFSMGGGVVYNYFGQTYGGTKYSSTVYGGSAFARYFILENLFAQVGADRLSVPDYTKGIANSRTWVDNILVGGGYRQQFSDRGTFVAMIFYNLNQGPLSPYQNPIVQVGFNIGL